MQSAFPLSQKTPKTKQNKIKYGISVINKTLDRVMILILSVYTD